MSRQVNALRWVGLTGLLLALAAILLVGYMSKGSTQEEPTAEKADDSKSTVEKTGKPEIDVYSVTSDGQTTQIRSSGKPPWAGGPQVVGPKHPGFGKSES